VPAETLTIRIDPEMRESLDAIAAAQDRNRTYVVREALRAYLDLYQWQVKHIQQGVREAEAGKFVSDAEMRRTIARLTRR
jgi:predicted transcriptional regulator